MACINMFNSEHQGLCGVPAAPPMSPRISFSNDFVVDPPLAPRGPPPPSDPNFEFSVGSHHMIAADQIFFKGRLLPLKENQGYCTGPQRLTTLRDELRAHDDGDDGDGRPPKGSIRWKELLGLRKAHCATGKKNDKNDGAMEAAEVHLGKSYEAIWKNASLKTSVVTVHDT
ncbi:hypothetical protein COCNU_05G004710 [Cocos nucifera]|uniref:Uncharacterized protein n=1 Tax=Cocos nucifera TaxID=13894 RepID=A0A8K0I833_COCNU|nr:hypothetical protein COCNU_05G004710 [Cocos nucifera]